MDQIPWYKLLPSLPSWLKAIWKGHKFSLTHIACTYLWGVCYQEVSLSLMIFNDSGSTIITITISAIKIYFVPAYLCWFYLSRGGARFKVPSGPWIFYIGGLTGGFRKLFDLDFAVAFERYRKFLLFHYVERNISPHLMLPVKSHSKTSSSLSCNFDGFELRRWKSPFHK